MRTNPASGYDLALRPGNELDLTGGQLNFVGGAAWVAQNVQCHLSLVLGEWFLDPTQGVPYFDSILVKNPNMPLVRSILMKAILAVPHVTGIASLNITLT